MPTKAPSEHQHPLKHSADQNVQKLHLMPPASLILHVQSAGLVVVGVTMLIA